jgi:hypothetical protein
VVILEKLVRTARRQVIGFKCLRLRAIDLLPDRFTPQTVADIQSTINAFTISELM